MGGDANAGTRCQNGSSSIIRLGDGRRSRNLERS
uniref:Uncharacterized protein n=1 Tax=Arundo donax TaxID=35708 RepID=A0A0A9A4B4_ARUDO